VTFDGGTLLFNAGFAMNRGAALNAGGGSIDTNGNDATLQGVVSGAGGLTKTGAGTLTLSGANTYTGGTVISGGTLKGDTTALQGDITNNDSLIFDQTADGTYAGDISGIGTVAKSGGGTLTLTGASTCSGALTMQAGRVVVNGGFAGPVHVQANTILGGSGAVGALASSGRVSPGNSIGTLTVNGSYTQNVGSVYEVEVDAAGNSDLIDVAGVPGTATINGGTVEVLAADGNYASSTDYTILNAVGGVTGTFDNVTSSLGFLIPSLTYNANDVVLTLTQNSTFFSNTGGTGNERAVGLAMDGIMGTATGDMSTILNVLTGLPSAGIRSAYNQMGGASLTAFTGTGFSSMARYGNSLSRRMDLFGPGQGASAGQGTRFGSLYGSMLAMGRETVMNEAGSTGVAAGAGSPTAPNRWNAWARTYGVDGDRDGHDIASRYDYTIWGIAFGLDRRVSRNLLVGVSGGYSEMDVDFDDLDDKGRAESRLASIYASYAGHAWYAKAWVSYAWNDYDMKRPVAFGALSRAARAEYDGEGLSGCLEAGYGIKAGGFRLRPSASLRFTRLSQDGFTETGAGALNLSVEREVCTSLCSGLGIGVSRQMTIGKDTVLTPEVHVMWAHEFSDDDHIVEARFTGAPSASFRVKGDRPERDSVIAGIGMTGHILSDLSFYVNYDADLRSDRMEHAVAAGLRFEW
jgi:outer membrane autotransporter protein